GNYLLTLITNSSNLGCADTIVKSVQVYYNPTADFTFNDVCFRDTVHFNNTSSVHNSTSITGYLWVFGDGGATSNAKDPSHYYSISGTYNVTLVSTTANGCSAVANFNIKVFDAPSNAFLFSNTCLFDSAVVTNSSANPPVGSIASWSWNFGDGSAINTSVWSPSHLYAAPGNYLLTLITNSSNLGCADTLKDTITVFPMPVANFGFVDVCLNQAMNFIDQSIVSIGSIASVSWNFGDGSPLDTNPITTHTYASPGSYTVSLIVSTNNSCKDTVTKTVTVHPLPDAEFSATRVCDGSIVTFNDLSTIPNTDSLQSWTWNFGDGSTLNNNQNTSHLYPTKGSYSVQLLVVSNFGCLDSITKISIVNPNPVVLFTANDTVGCEPLCIGFQDLSYIASGINVQWTWDFGEGNTASDPNHCYNNGSVVLPEFFSVTLTVTSDSGCISTLSKNNYITVYPNPNAGFAVAPQTAVITNPVISIIDASEGANFWTWNFGDGSDTVSAFNPLPHTYADTGTYTIMLVTSNQFSCLDTSYQTVIIEPDFLFYIPNAFTPNDDGVNDTFSGRGLVITKYEMTIFDRWGNLVFFSDNIDKPWDGRVNHGTEIAQGEVYIYSFKVTDFNMKKHEYKGVVTLVR
ncbi:MAG: PKD domain-containing protein, partial [Bacteroidetes bacterium]|nr:PKD domain-containing protein [Bacteroidota bacterium]